MDHLIELYERDRHAEPPLYHIQNIGKNVYLFSNTDNRKSPADPMPMSNSAGVIYRAKLQSIISYDCKIILDAINKIGIVQHKINGAWHTEVICSVKMPIVYPWTPGYGLDIRVYVGGGKYAGKYGIIRKIIEGDGLVDIDGLGSVRVKTSKLNCLKR